MDKKLIIILIVAAFLVFAVCMNYLLNAARESAENELRSNNPLFHTVPEGGECVEGRGDCEGGLTCVNGTCETY